MYIFLFTGLTFVIFLYLLRTILSRLPVVFNVCYINCMVMYYSTIYYIYM